MSTPTGATSHTNANEAAFATVGPLAILHAITHWLSRVHTATIENRQRRADAEVRWRITWRS